MSYLLENLPLVSELSWEHLRLTMAAIAIAAAVAVPVGALVRAVPVLRAPTLGLLGALYTIPSLAAIILLVPLLGLSAESVVAAAVLYAQAILVRNLLAGLDSIDPAILEAARGMGMTVWQRWWWVQLPLALPIVLAGVRLATIVTIAIATIGARFGAGGLGVLLFEGIQQSRPDKIWAGTLALALLALTLNGLLRGLEARSRRDGRIQRS